MTSQTEIKPIGGYIYPDSDGYLVNPTSTSNISRKWLELTETLTEAYITAYSDNLHSIYIRGSVAQGTMISDVSDLDSFCLVRNQGTEKENNGLQFLVDQIAANHTFANGIEAYALTVDGALANVADKFLIKILALRVWGEDVSSQIDKYQVSIDAMNFCLRLDELENRFIEYSKLLRNDKEEKRYCVAISKLSLRIAFEIVMIRESKFTRDLFYCWESYAKYYPQHSSFLRDFLNHAVNPIADVESVVGNWTRVCTIFREQLENEHHLRDE